MPRASPETLMPQGASSAPTTSPRSRPTFAGSVSMAPTVAGSRPSSVLEFICAGNCAGPGFLLLPQRKRIMKPAATARGEDSHASREAHGCRNSEANDECTRLEAENGKLHRAFECKD